MCTVLERSCIIEFLYKITISWLTTRTAKMIFMWVLMLDMTKKGLICRNYNIRIKKGRVKIEIGKRIDSSHTASTQFPTPIIFSWLTGKNAIKHCSLTYVVAMEWHGCGPPWKVQSSLNTWKLCETHQSTLATLDKLTEKVREKHRIKFPTLYSIEQKTA